MTISTAIPPYIVFGYGSLIFKPPPHVINQVPGYVKGYVRRFAQQSHDHRGTPENPGRVVTLIPKEDWDAFSSSDPFPEDDTVWGLAYTIDPAYASEVRDYLDYREKDGYTLETLDIYNIDPDTTQERASCYVGRKDNPSFIGSEPLDILADRILRSVGPSGPNKDYLYKLGSYVRGLSLNSYDPYLFVLEAEVREMDATNRSQLRN